MFNEKWIVSRRVICNIQHRAHSLTDVNKNIQRVICTLQKELIHVALTYFAYNSTYTLTFGLSIELNH